MPALIALLFYSKLANKTLTLIESITHYALFSLVTNCLMYGILIYFFKTTTFLFTNLFTLKYSFVATIISIIFVLIYRFIELNVKIKLEVKSENAKKN